MDRCYLTNRRLRLFWVGTVLFCHLFQQLAMAAYGCPQENRPSAASDCAAMMGTAVLHSSPVHADPRCAEHCAHHIPATAEARVTSLPPTLLPLAIAVHVMGVDAPVRSMQLHTHLVWTDPPPQLRFCSLLI